MSGFEVVGVVLGGLPLLIKVAHDYREGFEPFVKWVRFKNDFRIFINDVDVEKQMFDNIVDRLLRYAELEEETKKGLLKGNDLEGWRTIEVQRALEKRLGDSCEACLYLLEAIGDDFEKLESIMSLKDGSVS
ncbi:hypothetical protein HYFRA_00003485 [Hymenoscyphus fraxineus]|uniref:Uncharacterized protein n=1 Tax=Hymenoscyphus fraxineus TaxID=746836 RepID=A0A9N9KVB2_9HELO|nr:hypothetical protein HYFRA_00003485 [Hymenoscyphus fraxineus]